MAELDERVRVPRVTQERAERKRRKGQALESRLSIPQEIKEQAERDGKSLRWINDYDSRMHNKTVADDWDKVEGVKPITSHDANGKPFEIHLCAKPKQFLEEDRAEREAQRKDREEQMIRDRGAMEAAQAGAETYADEGNRIGKG